MALAIIEKKIKTANKTEEKYFLNTKAEAYNNIAVYHQQHGDIKIALEFYFLGLKIQQQIGDRDGESYSLNNIATVYSTKGELLKALEFHYKSLKLRKELGDKKGVAQSYSNLGLIYKNMGQIAKSLEYHTISLKIREEIGDKEGMAHSFGLLASTYDEQGEPDKALEFLLKSLKLCEENNDKIRIGVRLNDIGAYYSRQKNYDLAFEYFNKSLSICEKNNYKIGIAQAYNNLGSVYKNQKNYKLSLENFQKSLTIKRDINDERGLAKTLDAIADLFILQNNFTEAEIYAQQAMQKANELKYPILIKDAALLLKKIYKNKGNYKSALGMMELYINMRDSLVNEDTKKSTIKSELKYEYEKRAAADSVKNVEAQKVKDAQLQAQSASLKQEKTQRYALYGGLILVAGFLIFVVNRFRITNKQKKIIEEQKIVVDQAFEKLEMKQKEIMDSIHYAQRIQKALITSEFLVEKMFKKNKK